jgi:hypothetical protein
MKKIHTHYDNLKVMRNAPPEVVRAAYKTLTQKYHPDRNPGDAKAARIMSLLNDSYGVLSDPVKRRSHDQWIEKCELEGETQEANSSDPTMKAKPKWKPAEPVTPPKEPSPLSLKLKYFGWLAESSFAVIFRVMGPFLGLALVILVIAVVNTRTTNKPDFTSQASPVALPQSYSAIPPPSQSQATTSIGPEEIRPEDVSATPPPARPHAATPTSNDNVPVYVRAPLTPYGMPWPASAAYLKEFPILRAKGLSKVTVDNNQNSSDVLVKLVWLGSTKAFPIREFFIPAHGTFTVNRVSAGKYDVRYRDLDSGQLTRSEAFDLEETRIPGGTEYSNYNITLYTVPDGNMQTYSLAESDF